MNSDKLDWQGTITAIQPRIRLTRSFDQRYHSYLGYVLRLQGEFGEQEGEFLIAIGEAAQAKHQFQIGDVVSGRSAPLADHQLETAGYHKTATLKLIGQASGGPTPPPRLQAFPLRLRSIAGMAIAGSVPTPIPRSARTISGAAAWPSR